MMHTRRRRPILRLGRSSSDGPRPGPAPRGPSVDGPSNRRGGEAGATFSPTAVVSFSVAAAVVAAGGDAEAGEGCAICGVAHFRVCAEITNDHNLVQASHITPPSRTRRPAWTRGTIRALEPPQPLPEPHPQATPTPL